MQILHSKWSNVEYGVLLQHRENVFLYIKLSCGTNGKHFKCSLYEFICYNKYINKFGLLLNVFTVAVVSHLYVFFAFFSIIFLFHVMLSSSHL